MVLDVIDQLKQHLTSFVYNILPSYDERNFTITVFLDSNKAFDTVEQNILLKKGEHYGIRGTANKWLTRI